MSQPLPKLAGANLAALRPRLRLPAQAIAAIAKCETVPQAVDALEKAALAVEAIKLMAHALPKREAVWWACMCAQYTAPRDLPEPDRLAREAAEAWVRRPDDKTRRKANAYAEAADFATPEAWAGVAAFWSGDSLAPEDQAAVPPAPHLTGLAVTSVVTLASVRGGASRQPERLKRFLESARNIAAGGAGRLPPEAGSG